MDAYNGLTILLYGLATMRHSQALASESRVSACDARVHTGWRTNPKARLPCVASSVHREELTTTGFDCKHPQTCTHTGTPVHLSAAAINPLVTRLMWLNWNWNVTYWKRSRRYWPWAASEGSVNFQSCCFKDSPHYKVVWIGHANVSYLYVFG